LSAGRRSDVRRARRLAENLGPVSCAVETPTPGNLDRLLDEALRVEAAGWKGAAGSAVLHDTLRRPFYQRYAATACADGTLRLCYLRIGDRVAAMQMAVECGQRFWLLKIGHDEAFARCSPWMLLILETLRYAAACGLRSYEFLGSPAPWTRMWTKDLHPCLALRVYPARGRAIAALATDVARSGWRRLARLGWRGT
jgi:CelD/BcsL family acetyltransferase involved in cellulose biosynthesis